MTKSWYKFNDDGGSGISINPRSYESSIRVRIINNLDFDIYMIWV